MKRPIVRRRGLTLIGSGLASIAFTSNALAQDASPQVNSAAVGADARQSTDAASGLDIVVTAQRRSERVLTIPISITAVTGAGLAAAGVTDSQSLALVTTGVLMSNGGGNSQPTIRGITTSGAGAGEQPNVATYIDGVLHPSQKTNFYDLDDVDRVEILKGPQGTLFGANASGGAIRVFTRGPSATPEVSLRLGVGNYNQRRASAFISGPLAGDTLTASLSGLESRADGFSRNLVTGKRDGKFHSRYVRGKLRFNPNDILDLTLSGMAFDRKDPNAYSGTVLDDNTRGRAVGAALGTPAIYGRKPFETGVTDPNPSFLSGHGYETSLYARVDLGGVRLTSISAYQSLRSELDTDLDYSSIKIFRVNFHERARIFTHEINLASDTKSRLQWVLGYFYYNNNDALAERINNDPLDSNLLYFRSKGHSHAVFGELTYGISEELTAIVGARYSSETSTGYTGTGSPDTIVLGSTDTKRFTPRVSLRYNITPQTNVYATYSKGFKSGLFAIISRATVPVKPEDINAYEIGIKSALSRAVQFTAAGYYYDYKNLQFSQYLGNTSLYRNVGTARIYGAEFSVNLQPVRDLRIKGGLAYLHTEYVSFPGGATFVPTLVSGVPVGGNTATPKDVSGMTMVKSPKLTANLGIDYTSHIGGVLVEPSVNLAYSSRYFFELSYRLSQKPIVQINSQIRFKLSRESRISVSVWAKNLTELSKKEAVQSTVFGDFANYSPPRTFGLALGFDM